MSYEEFTPRKDDVVYCDIPYDSKVGYGVEFDFDKFIEWCKEQPVPIYYSYYTVGECLWSKPHRTSNITVLSTENNSLRYEGLMRI